MESIRRVTSGTVHPPVADHPESIYDISPGGHIAWMWLLHYLAGFYRTAFVEESPRCFVDRIERIGPVVKVSGHQQGGATQTFEVPLDGSYDVIALPFDLGFGFRGGHETLLYL